MREVMTAAREESEAPREKRHDAESAPMQVRAADLQPYVGLRYLAKLFRVLALVVALLLLAEIVTGLRQQGTDAIGVLISEGSRLLVLAGLLYGGGDLVMLLIDIGHDVRATRILLGRQVAHQHPAADHDALDDDRRA